MNYVKKMGEVIDNVGDDFNYEKILECNNEIRAISDYVKTTGLFKSHLGNYLAHCQKLDRIDDKKIRLEYAWGLFIEKIGHAHDQFQFAGAVILLVPIINHAIQN